MNWKRNQNLVIGLGVAALFLILVVIYLLFFRSSGSQKNIPPPISQEPRHIQSRIPPPRSRPPPPSQEVPQPTQKNEGTAVGDGKPALVLFYSERCGHSRNMMNDWEEAKQNLLSSDQFDVISFEEKDHPQEMQKHGIKGYPTVRYYPGGFPSQNFIEYRGNRSADSFILFAQSGGNEV